MKTKPQSTVMVLLAEGATAQEIADKSAELALKGIKAIIFPSQEVLDLWIATAELR